MAVYASRRDAVLDRLMIVIEAVWKAYPRVMSGPCAVVNALVGHVAIETRCRKCKMRRSWLSVAQYGELKANGSVPHCPNGALVETSVAKVGGVR